MTRPAFEVEIKQVAPPEVHPAEAAVEATLATPLGRLVAGHLIGDGEIVLLLTRPSLLSILLSGWQLIVFVCLAVALAALNANLLPGHRRDYVQLGVLIIALRLGVSTVQWMGRYYVLTDRRVLTLSGVLHVDVWECPLRRLARPRLLRSWRDRVLRLAHLELIPEDERLPIGTWLWLGRPESVYLAVLQAMRRAKS
jgi:hypothetical protein